MYTHKKMIMSKVLISSILLFFSFLGFAQKGEGSFGIQFKPILPFQYLNSGTQTFIEDDHQFDLKQKLGYSFGMNLRFSLSNMWSIESGIGFVQRNFQSSVLNFTSQTQVQNNIRMIAYEIPLQALVYIKLSDAWYMNTSLGLSADFYPTEWLKNKNDQSQIAMRRRRWVQLAILANFGFEYRTKNKGYWYTGFSFHRPFSEVYLAGITWFEANNTVLAYKEMGINGNYLTIDFRYFFKSAK